MGVEAVPVETTWATCVLDLQSNKTDLQFGLQATPKRALVIDFAGPAYNLYWYAVNHSGFKASSWEDYNKPEVKIAAMLGSADVVILQKVAPKATRIELNDVASTALAVTSGRADAMVTAVFGALVAKNRNRISATSCCRRQPSICLPMPACGAKTTTPSKSLCRPGPSGTICSVIRRLA
jgi:polar amino acid transport system substrate-binding protein